MLELAGVSKAFGAARALDDMALEVRGGEIHALVGHNGSGKSTLVKILAGFEKPDSYEHAHCRGRPFELGSPSAARVLGLRFVHQDLGLAPTLTVAENLALRGEGSGRLWLSVRAERRRARETLADYGADLDVERPVGELSVAEQTMVALVGGLAHAPDGSLLVLDEPTAALPDREARRLFGVLRAARGRGGSVLYVSHRLNELFDIADRVTVVRGGRFIATRRIAELDHDRLVELMLGASVQAYYPAPPKARAERVLEVRHLSGASVHDVSLDLHSGEIIGVTGLIGSGYDEVLGLLFGAQPSSAGSVRLHGRPLPTGSPVASIRAGIAYAHADRRQLSAISDWSLRENVTLPTMATQSPGGWLSARAEAKGTKPWLDKLTVEPPDPERLFRTLSGGNQQKVVLARWLRTNPKVLLLDEPTSGVDTGAKTTIYRIIAEAAAGGTAVIVASSDVEELAAIADRVLVMQGGSVTLTAERGDLTAEALAAASLGHDPLTDPPTLTTQRSVGQ